MVSYIARPIIKTVPHMGAMNVKNLTAYAPNLALWGGATTFGLFVFTEGIPVFQNAIYKKIPVIGEHWVYNPDPADLPF